MQRDRISNNINLICIKVDFNFLFNCFLYFYMLYIDNSGFYYGGKRYHTHLYVCVETVRKRIKRKREQSFSYFFFFTMLLFLGCVPLLISQSFSLSLSRSPHTSARECVASSPPDCQHTHYLL
jgi:hypothetical protein